MTVEHNELTLRASRGKNGVLQPTASIGIQRRTRMKIEIRINDIVLAGKLDASLTAGRIAAALPIEGRANRWGEEIYFEIPIDIDLDDRATEEVEPGTLAYWPTGRALCIFFGPTPVSTGDKPRAYSPVNICGRIEGPCAVLKQVPDGAVVRITQCP
jgi:hypothetical protein